MGFIASWGEDGAEHFNYGPLARLAEFFKTKFPNKHFPDAEEYSPKECVEAYSQLYTILPDIRETGDSLMFDCAESMLLVMLEAVKENSYLVIRD